MLRFHFFTAKQGTWVHKYDRDPLAPKIEECNKWRFQWENWLDPFLPKRKHNLSLQNMSITYTSFFLPPVGDLGGYV